VSIELIFIYLLLGRGESKSGRKIVGKKRKKKNAEAK
jgi:hypothetical protein